MSCESSIGSFGTPCIKNTNVKKDSNSEMTLEDFTEKTFKIYLNTLGM